MHDTYDGRRKPACITGDRVKVNDRDWPRLIARIIYQQACDSLKMEPACLDDKPCTINSDGAPVLSRPIARQGATGEFELINKSLQYTEPDGTIDVKKLIAAYTFEEHALRADKYFETIVDPWAYHLRKPFTTVDECAVALAALSGLLPLLKLQRGHHIVDFGCGTGWLSAAMALMQCQVTGIDISQRALDIALSAVLEHPTLKEGRIDFRRLGESGIPLETSSVERIVCFDSFHHVADQHFYLQEFFRVLRPGGIVGFSEPGPGHSRSLASQYEMRNFAVIENDIVLEEISSMAKAVGFEKMNMSVFADTPMVMPVEEFLSLANEGRQQAYEDLGSWLFKRAKGRSVFALHKPGEESLDSRTASALGADVSIVGQSFDVATRRLAVTLLVHNTGTGAWLPSGANIGSMNIGVRISTENGSPIGREPIRFDLANVETKPGRSIRTDLLVDIPPGGNLVVEFDLVAEHVAWLSQIALRPPRISLPASR